MKRNLWVLAAASLIVLGVAGYTSAQSTGNSPQGGPGWMMGPGAGMMGGGMMGQGRMMDQRNMMSGGMMNMMMGQALTQEQLEQFAQQHGITLEQAKQMTEACTQVMTRERTPEAPTQ